jgi:hypothetical protein
MEVVGELLPWRFQLVTELRVYVELRDFEVFSEGIAFSLIGKYPRSFLPEFNNPDAEPVFAENSIQLSIVFPDGRIASLTDFPSIRNKFGPTMRKLGGGGRGGVISTVRMDLWLCPLLPNGEAMWIFQWGELGLPESEYKFMVSNEVTELAQKPHIALKIDDVQGV